MKAALPEVLKAVGKETHSLTLSDGSEILVLPFGGRVLGLYAPGDDRNFLWTNPALAEAGEAKAFYDSGVWANSGGDRTWLAPEIDFFLPKFPETSPYFQPRSLDPGSYSAEVSDKEIRFGMDFSMTPFSTKVPVSLRMTKSVRSARDPLKMSGVQYAGYELQTTLEALGPITTSIGTWSLLQMPPHGEMIFPTYSACDPLVVFGNPLKEDLTIGDRELRYRMGGAGDHKISLPANFSTGRVGYFYEANGACQLIVRNFFVNLSGDYVDASWTDPKDDGYGVQACSVNGEFGLFSELEYHAPAMTQESRRSSDTSQVWAYRGTREQLAEVARRLIGAEL